MSLDTTVPRSRRALLGAAIGAAVATVASALGRPAPVRAGTDGDVVLGAANEATTTTTIVNSTTPLQVLNVQSSQGSALMASSSSTQSMAVYGYGGSGVGVFGASGGSQPAMRGWAKGNATGVYGSSGTPGQPPDPPAGTGVYGYADEGNLARGVFGQTTGGTGVRGEATSGAGVIGISTSGAGVYGQSDSDCGVLGTSPSGTAVMGDSDLGRGVSGSSYYGTAVTAESPAGTALDVRGKVKFDRAGTVRIYHGHSQATKKVTGMTSSTWSSPPSAPTARATTWRRSFRRPARSQST